MKVSELIALLSHYHPDKNVVCCPLYEVNDWCQDFMSGSVGETQDGKLVLALTEETTSPDEEEIQWHNKIGSFSDPGPSEDF